MGMNEDIHEMTGTDPNTARTKSAKQKYGAVGVSAMIERGLNYQMNRSATYEGNRQRDENREMVSTVTTTRGSPWALRIW